MGMELSFYSYDIKCFQLTILKACRISMNISSFFVYVIQKLEKTMNKLNAFPKRNFESCSF